jgi:S-DNA-T family DNA segregation ATPase FtsK/SpoIIIE
VPAAVPPGRGLLIGHGASRSPHQVQVALLTDDPAGPAQLAALRALVTAARARHEGQRLLHQPIRVDPLPSAVSVDRALSLGPSTAQGAPLWALIGVGGDRLQPLGVDLAEIGPGFLVAGPPRSGRSTALLTMADFLLRSGRRVCLVAPGGSPLRRLASHQGVSACLDPAASEDQALAALSCAGPPDVIVVDDAERLTDSAIGAALERELLAEPGKGACVVAAGNNTDLQSTYRGFTLALRRSRCGLLLTPQSSADGDLLGAQLPRQLRHGQPSGRALLAVRGLLTPVQVAQS